jgi:hypothetical protein
MEKKKIELSEKFKKFEEKIYELNKFISTPLHQDLQQEMKNLIKIAESMKRDQEILNDDFSKLEKQVIEHKEILDKLLLLSFTPPPSPILPPSHHKIAPISHYEPDKGLSQESTLFENNDLSNLINFE